MDIEKAFKKLLVKNPFYGLFCINLPKNITTDISTLCVTKHGINCQLNINPEFWEKHTDDEQIALLIHELSHICLQHMFICDLFPDKKLFNLAADAEVNSYIDNLPEDAVTNVLLSKKLGIPVEKGLGTKKYYELLSQYKDSQSNQAASEATSDQGSENESGSSSGNQNEKQDNQYPQEMNKKFNPVDDHSTWKEFKDMPEANKQLMQNNIDSILKTTAEEVEKMRGSIPGNLVEIIENLKKKKPRVFDWKSYFRRMLGSIYDVNIRSTRRKESKRFKGSAGIQHRKKVSIMVAVDTSGSVSEKELQEFFSEIYHVYKDGARVTIVECDSDINSITEYDGKTIPEIKGRGGTSFYPPVDYYLKHKKDYAALVYFTDGYAEIPKNCPMKMVWVISSSGCKQDYPGTTVYIPKETN